MRPWLRSPRLLKYLIGQHIVNGVSVAAGVAAVSIVGSSILGFAAAQPMTLGAISGSVSDFPAPWPVKGRTMAVGFGLSIVSTTVIGFAGGSTIGLILAFGVFAFIAGIVTGYGRWALALNAQILIPAVFMLGLPPMGAVDRLRAEALYAVGGLVYIGLSLGVSAWLEANDRRLAASECFRELAAYLNAIARFGDPKAELSEVYGAGLRQQAALSEQLQSARALLLYKGRMGSERLRLAASIGVMLDAFDSLVATLSDAPRLRALPQAAVLNQRVAVLLEAGGRDLQGLSLSLLAHETPRLPPDHGVAFEAVRREGERLAALPEIADADKAAVAATLRRLGAARDHVLRLERILTDDEEARATMVAVHLAAFRPSRSFDPQLLWPHLEPGSPSFRYATRLALAMMSGGLVAAGLGYAGHGNWVLLTIAVILRPSFGLTKQRRNDRLVGTLIGCGLASVMVACTPLGGLMALQIFALALTHSFVRLDYRLASTGASVMALLTLHLVSPGEPAAALARLADTLVGAAIAHLFNHFWPSWELAAAPGIVKRLLKRAANFAKVALDPQAPAQDYRLARKDLIEAVAASADAAARMDGEPPAARRGTEEMAAMLIAASVFASRVSAARLDLQASESEAEIRARAWAAARLAGQPAPADDDASTADLRQAVEGLVATADAFTVAAGSA